MSGDETYRSLVDKYEKTKHQLFEAETTIRRITGRAAGDVINIVPGGALKYRPNSFSVSERTSYPGKERKRSIYKRGDQVPENDPASEDSSMDESSNKPSLPSRVVAKGLFQAKKSRKATVRDQNCKSVERNRRMFGVLIGTLEKFKSDEKKREHVVSKRAEIEQKVEAATEEQREKIKKEKETLFITRREKQVELRCLEKKIERAESHEVFDSVHQKMLNFIKTKSKPPIFFLPVTHTTVSKKYYEESRNELKALLDQKRADLESDLAEIEELYRKDSGDVPSISSDKEDICPKDESESQDVPETGSESLMVEQEDTVPEEEDKLIVDRHLADSISDQEFEPIYD